MPYIFRPERAPVADDPVADDPVAGGFLRMLLADRPVIITERELQSLRSRDREYFGYVSTETAIAITRRLLDSLMQEDAAAQPAQNALAQVRQEYEAAQTVGMVQRALGTNGPTARQLRAAEEMANAVQRRRRATGDNPYRPTFTPSHSNEGDIEPEDL